MKGVIATVLLIVPTVVVANANNTLRQVYHPHVVGIEILSNENTTLTIFCSE